jgi:hypothetical protein
MIALTSTDWILVAATIAGPILAVRAQKVIESLTEKRKRKLHIFRILMATRAARISGDHVQALNMIDIEFSASKVLGVFRYQSPKEKAVISAWRDYLESLSPLPPEATEEEKKRWNERTLDHFINLLSVLSEALGFEFDKVQLKKGIYSPQAHGDTEEAQLQIRDSLVKILSGKQSFPMAVTHFPVSQEALDLQTQVQTAMLASLSGEKPLRVSVDGDKPVKGAE